MEIKGNLSANIITQESILQDTGAANAYVVTLSQTDAVAYTTGLRISFKATYANTGASTLNVNSLGVKTIKAIDGTDLTAGNIPANGIVEVIYNGTNFQLLSSIPGTIYFDNTYFGGAGTLASPLTIIGGTGGFPAVEVAASYSAISASTTKRLIQVTTDETNSNTLTMYYHTGSGLLRISTTAVTTTTSTSSSTTTTTTSGGSYTVERRWNIHPGNQFVAATALSGWHFLPATSNDTVPNGTAYTNLRDSTNSTTNPISVTATSLWSGSSGSVGPTSGGGAGSDWGCSDIIVQHAWTTTGTASIKIGGLVAGKYYQIGVLANTFGFEGISQSWNVGGTTISSYATGNQYGTCAGDDLTDPVIKWVYDRQADGSGEIAISVTKTAGSYAAFTAMVILQTNIAHG